MFTLMSLCRSLLFISVFMDNVNGLFFIFSSVMYHFTPFKPFKHIKNEKRNTKQQMMGYALPVSIESSQIKFFC